MVMRKFIVGTDWWTDCDDVIAMKLLARAVTEKKAELLGIGINACMQYSVASLKNYLNSCGVSDVPIGIDRQAVDYGGEPPYQKRLAEISGGKPDNAAAPDAADMYIKILSQSSEMLEIIEIGYPQVLAQVLKREPALFKEKVSKIWMMAGKWDENPGRENNFARNSRSAAAGHYLCLNCPVPITFLGFETGESVIVGSKLDHSDRLYAALADHGSQNGRNAWDPMLVQMAVIGNEKKAGYKLVKGTAYVDEITGKNFFEKSENGIHGYVEKLFPDDYYKDIIDELISR